MVDVTSSQKMQLRQNGLAATRPRMALLKVLEAQAQPLHIDDIVELAGGDLALSTVYRAVGELLEVGLVSSLNSPEGRKMVELSTEHTSHHHHVLCKGCDSATDIQFTDDLEEQIEAEMKLIAETMGVEVHSHSLEILGICRDCASDSTTCFCRGDNCESDK
jgi:Fe2+ or Zn2+ uptake regulation protein|tara:strand:+ start:1279 stop:1764 length:486 start_codon:yes stop_codon:yes gene_type:complete